MSALGHKRTCAAQPATSALGQKRTLHFIRLPRWLAQAAPVAPLCLAPWDVTRCSFGGG
jgi:hypothetical protein